MGMVTEAETRRKANVFSKFHIGADIGALAVGHAKACFELGTGDLALCFLMFTVRKTIACPG